MTSQSVHQLGGYRVQGKTQRAVERLIEDAKAVEAVGAFAVVLEAVTAGAAKAVTAAVSIPKDHLDQSAPSIQEGRGGGNVSFSPGKL